MNNKVNKKIILWSILLSSVISLESCSDDTKFGGTDQPVLEGTEIQIGASASYSPNNNTRTIYPGIVVNKVERINWMLENEYPDGNWAADQIRIYSPEAYAGENQHFADYKVISHTQKNPPISTTPDGVYKESNNSHLITPPDGQTANASDEGRFVVLDNMQGLKWGEEQTHNFYSVYPAPGLNSSVSIESQNGEVHIKGTINPGQSAVGYIKDPNAPQGVNSYIALPVMRQNYMWAVTTADAADKAKNAVSLNFKTIPTTVEIDLVWPFSQEIVTVTSVRLDYIGTENVNLGGKFDANLTQMVNGYPTVTSLETADAIKSININLDANPDDDKVGVTLKGGEHLKVRFIMLPIQNLDGKDLRLTVTGPNGSRSHNLSNKAGGFMVQPSKINRLLNVAIPGKLKGNNWISLLPDNVLLSQLSIPGTGSSCLFNNDANDNRLYAQSKTVDEQWEMGIRCFDITATRLKDHADLKSFGDIPLRIDNKILVPKIGGKRLTVKDAFDNLLAKVKITNPDKVNTDDVWNGEFGMLILRYQPAGERSSQDFVNNFEEFFSVLKSDGNYTNRFCLFKPGLTVQDARGKIMVILCPTSEGEDPTVTATDNDYLMIDGNGSMPDKFMRRGYYYTLTDGTKTKVTNPAPNGLDKTKETSAEHYIVNWEQGTLSREANDVNFVYNTNQGFKAWFQDWTRVIDGAGSELKPFTVPWGTGSTKEIKWPASYQEKLDNVKASFLKAVNNKNNKDNVYINSLCGFLVTGNDHYYTTDDKGNQHEDYGQITPIYNGNWPSFASNIKALADKLNPAFYKYMHDLLRTGQYKGPMGVVLMNFVGDESIAGSVSMPVMVISNNFNFPLLTGIPGQEGGGSPIEPDPQPELDTKPNSDGSYDAGGWLWGE